MLNLRKKNKFDRSVIAQKKRSFFVLKFILILILTISLISFFVWLCNTKYTMIDDLEIVGTETISKNDIQNILKDDLSGKKLFLIPKNNIFFINLNKLEKKLSKEKLEILAISIKRGGLNKLEITIVERQPFGVWCQNREVGERDNLEDLNCFFVDKDGLIFKETSYAGESIFHIYETFDMTFLLNTFIVDTGLFSRSRELMGLLITENVDIYGININPDNYFEFLVNDGYIIKFNPKIDEIFNVEDFLIAYNKKLQEKEGDFSNLKYIDMRYKNKALFMFE